MRLFSYIVVHDHGFSPNPFHGYCTLACCKPQIRRRAGQGDWIVGISTKATGNRLIYAMEVTEPPMPFADYFSDRRFRKKIPVWTRDSSPLDHVGDIIYEPTVTGGFRQLRSRHSNGPRENPDKKRVDLGGKFVLISKRFWYYGSKARELPEELHEIIPQRGYRSRFSETTIARALAFATSGKSGRLAMPSSFPSKPIVDCRC